MNSHDENMYEPIPPTNEGGLDFRSNLERARLSAGLPSGESLQTKFTNWCNEPHPHLKKLLKFALFILVIWLIISIFIEKEELDNYKISAIEYIHSNCTLDDYCTSSWCPIATIDNPITLSIKNSKLANSLLEQALQDVNTMNQQITALPQEMGINSDGLAKLQTSSTSLLAAAQQAAGVISSYTNTITNFTQSIATSSVSSNSYFVKLQSEALLEAIKVQSTIIKLQLVSLIMNVSNTKISTISPTVTTQATTMVNTLSSNFASQLLSASKAGANSITVITNILGDTTTVPPTAAIADANGVINQLVMLQSIFTSAKNSLQNSISIAGQLVDILNTYSPITNSFSNKEGFNNTMPGSESNQLTNELIADNNYVQSVINTSLEPSILSSHKRYAKELNEIGNGNKLLAVRDDPNDINPWVGFNRPTYRKSDGSSAEINRQPLKQIPSDNIDDQMQDGVHLSFTKVGQ